MICRFEWTRPLIGPRYRGQQSGAAIGGGYRGQPIRGLVNSKQQIMSFQKFCMTSLFWGLISVIWLSTWINLRVHFLPLKIAFSWVLSHARIFGSCARVHTRIFTKNNLVITFYLMSLSFKFRKYQSFRWGDIPLFVTVYDLELKILSFSKPPKNAILSAKKRPLRFIFFNIFFDNKH